MSVCITGFVFYALLLVVDTSFICTDVWREFFPVLQWRSNDAASSYEAELQMQALDGDSG